MINCRACDLDKENYNVHVFPFTLSLEMSLWYMSLEPRVRSQLMEIGGEIGNLSTTRIPINAITAYIP